MPNVIHISPPYHDLLARLSLDTPEAVYADERLRVWRNLEDRDNSTLDVTRPDGSPIRLHVKRDKHKRREPMALEARGIGLLNAAGIESAPLVAHGAMGDGRTFVITENLDGYLSADRLIETGVERLPVLLAMAGLAATLHNAQLHHRDLYTNHFYIRGDHVRLIDTARVRALPRLFRERWIVKDVGQLIFSVGPYVEGTDHVAAMLARYAESTGRTKGSRFDRRVLAKAAWIDRHDRALRARKPTRNLRLADGN
jgi:Lipopolysaccharide kinase (Kdo/WaaP) family